MQELTESAGPIATAIICLLIFAEEAGVPLPMFPGDLLLITAGVMVAAGQISPWLFLPCALLSGVAGAMLGYTWTRHVGQAGLQRVADRLRVRRHVDAAAGRLRSSGATGVVVGRLVIPGTRVYTTLVAGAVGMRPLTFLRGLFPSTLLWVLAFTGLGWLVGYPAVRYLHQLQWLLFVLLGQLALLAATVAVLRYVRTPRRDSLAGPTAVRTIFAGSLDAVLGAGLGLAGWAVSGAGWEWASPSVCIALLSVALVPRLALRSTAGELVAQLSYRDALTWISGGVSARLTRLAGRFGSVERTTITDA